MKKIALILGILFVIVACNNAADDQAASPDTTSSLPAPATVDTNSLKTDTPKVEKALRK